MVYYRKYRPQTIAELDLAAVRTRLSSILSTKELPHAFLFTGPKGLGKTSSARILAKAINCENRKSIEPCNACDNCVSITRGSNIDVLEIDAASNRGIDEIRDLREKIKFAPVTLPTKVYIIDEVHMLTTDAFNALLKTLEEPPSHVVFILCTTEVEKVPSTIASRTFHVQFSKPTSQEIIVSIERIIKGEKLEVEKEVLTEIFKLSEGSFRDAAKILEELAISANGGKITKEILETTYKTAGNDIAIQNLMVALSKKDLASAMKVTQDLALNGADFKVITEKLAQLIHDVLMSRAGVSESEFDIADFSIQDLNKLLTLVNESYRDIKFSVLPQIPLELAIITWCLGEADYKFEKNDDKVEKSINDKTQIADKKPDVAESQLPDQGKSSENHGVLFSKDSKPENFMAAFLVSIKQDNHSMVGILRGCRLVEITAGKVIFETKYKFHRDRLSDPKSAAILDSRASELLKEDVKVVVNLVGNSV